MNSRREAELQRKLGMNAVPSPPADLARQIKRAIPENLGAGSKPARSSSGFALRIAASLLVALSSGLLAWFVVTSREPETRITVPRSPRVAVPAVTRGTDEGQAVTTAAAPPAETVRRAQEEAPTATRTEPAAAAAETTPDVAELAWGVESGAEGGIEGEAAGTLSEDAATTNAVAEFTTGQPAEAVAAAPAAAAAPVPQRSAREAADFAAGGVVGQAKAAPAPPPPARMARQEPVMLATEPRSLFGVSVDARAVDRVRRAIESGAQVPPRSIDVEALVNYFAGREPRATRDGLRMEMEASPLPLGGGRDRVVLRVTVDAAPLRQEAVARDASIAVEFGPAVTRSRRIGGGRDFAAAASVAAGSSVTVLYELTLAPGVSADQRMASARLAFSALDGEKRAAERSLSAGDVEPRWGMSSLRHRLATLAAAWAESLQSESVRGAVARSAEALAQEAPGEPRARELAELASAARDRLRR